MEGKSLNNALTRREMLVQMMKIGIAVRNDDVDDANFDRKNDPPIQIKRILSLHQIDLTFSQIGRGSPWGVTLTDQEKMFGGCLLTAVETLKALENYKVKRGHLPRPDVWWAMRCRERYGDGESLVISSCPKHKLDVWHYKLDYTHPRLGALGYWPDSNSLNQSS